MTDYNTELFEMVDYIRRRVDGLYTHLSQAQKERGLCQVSVANRFRDVEVELARLKVKAGVWGLIAGTIPVVTLLGIHIVLNWPGG